MVTYRVAVTQLFRATNGKQSGIYHCKESFGCLFYTVLESVVAFAYSPSQFYGQ